MVTAGALVAAGVKVSTLAQEFLQAEGVVKTEEKESAKQFSKAIPPYQQGAGEGFAPPSHQCLLWLVSLFNFGHSNRCVMGIHCSFNSHFPK